MQVLSIKKAETVWVGLGANLGDTVAQLCEARRQLEIKFEVLAVSSLYRSAPIDCLDQQNDYLNAVMGFQADLTAHEVLVELFSIEKSLGRIRSGYHSPRMLDLDLLTYGQHQISDAVLTVPHPAMLDRAFVLQPLLELMPYFELPCGIRIEVGLKNVVGQAIQKYTSEHWIPQVYIEKALLE
jgi:2-amino-4-hydroxy-6-hydroxymethyldihydropteridine diphosphokinase